MDLNDKEAPAGKDRISNLTDSLIHHILSFLEIKQVAQTSVLSKQWRSIWTSIPILVFGEWRCSDLGLSSLQVDDFMDFVDGTLLRRSKTADIQKFSLTHVKHLKQYRVTSWITNVTSRNVQEFILSLRQQRSFRRLSTNWPLRQGGSFIVPVSLCTCASLVSLKLDITTGICLPKCISLPQLKRLTLGGIYVDNECWNEKLFSKCPVLEDLSLEHCYYATKTFCISIATLKLLKIYNSDDEYGLENCALKIHAPDLVSLVYTGWEAKEFVLPASPNLVEANLNFYNANFFSSRELRISYGTSIIQFLRALTHVRRLIVSGATLQALSFSDDLLENLPTFHNTKQLIMREESSDKAVIALLKATPNLESLIFDKIPSDDKEEDDVAGDDAEGELNHENKDDDWILDAVIPGCLFAHLKSVCFKEFIASPREMKWVHLILKNAKPLQTVTISSFHFAGLLNGKSEELMKEITSLPRSSTSCVFKFPSWHL